MFIQDNNFHPKEMIEEGKAGGLEKRTQMRGGGQKRGNTDIE
jgi:hypothetical protein